MRFYDLVRGRHLCMLEFDEIRSSVFMIGSKICPLTSVCMPRRSVGSIGLSRILTPSSDRRDNKYVRGSVLPRQRRISTDRVASPYAECSPTVETMQSKGRAGGACCRYDKAITDYDAALTEGVLTLAFINRGYANFAAGRFAAAAADFTKASDGMGAVEPGDYFDHLTGPLYAALGPISASAGSGTMTRSPCGSWQTACANLAKTAWGGLSRRSSSSREG